MIEIEEYINSKKELYSIIISIIETEETSKQDYQYLTDLIKTQKIEENGEDLRTLLHLIITIANNHQRNPDFFDRIDKILSILYESIKQTFSNIEIFNLFKSNDRLLLFLFENNILFIDQSISELILNSDHSKLYFFKEIKGFISEKKKRIIGRGLLRRDMKIFENFDVKRKKGENESKICSLIRNDSVEEFIAFVNRNLISLNITITSSIFETNLFLIENEPTLIEYAAFFGSIQIFTYLKLNNVALSPSLWLYSIHSKNPELIHILEENHILPNDASFQRCLEESIKCHHNDISNYIIDNLLDKSVENENLSSDFYRNSISYAFHYYNYDFIPIDLNNQFIFFYLCKYDYFVLVKLLLKAKKMILNSLIISMFFF